MKIGSVYGFAPLEFTTDAKYADSLGIERDGKLYKGTRLGDGFVKNREAIQVLKDGGFTDGCFVIELSNKTDRFKKTLESVEWIRKAVECS